MSEREEKYEAMLSSIQREYEITSEKLRQLKEQGKEKTATYRQLLGQKLTLQDILARYRAFGLLD